MILAAQSKAKVVTADLKAGMVRSLPGSERVHLACADDCGAG